MKLKLLLTIGLAVGAFIGGWKANGWRLMSKMSEQWQAVVDERDKRWGEIVSEFRQELEAEQKKTLALQARERQHEANAAQLQGEIDNAKFQTTCALNDPEFWRLYDAAASGGEGATETGESEAR